MHDKELPKIANLKSLQEADTLLVLNKIMLSPDWYVERKPWRLGESNESRS